ncbi:hypothetical protein BJV74DRAFT_123847 [Russula compacta]|nr:hypothetical protein BJV74DRAFT_123847 [Russula compacta]
MSRSSNLPLRPLQHNATSMSQVPGQPAADLESGKEKDGDLEQPQPELESAPNQPPQPLQGGSNFHDSSGPLFTMYSNITEEEDNKVAERWQNVRWALGFFRFILCIIAAFLALSIPDLIPDSQDINTFYLQNIYQFQVLAPLIYLSHLLWPLHLNSSLRSGHLGEPALDAELGY